MAVEFEITIKESVYSETTGQLRLQTWVSKAPEEYDPNVFVYQVVPGIPGTTQQDKFVHIAGYADMYAFIPDTPDAELPYYRKKSYDLLFNSSEKLTDARELTSKFIKQLLQDISRKDNIPLANLVVNEI